MAALVVTLKPISIIESGELVEVFGELLFDGGDYATGGITITVVDFTTTDLSAANRLAKFLQVSGIHATRPPISWNIRSGNGKNTLAVVPLAGVALPAIGVVVSSSGAESTNGAAVDSTLQTPPFPNTVTLRFRKNL